MRQAVFLLVGLLAETQAYNSYDGHNDGYPGWATLVPTTGPPVSATQAMCLRNNYDLNHHYDKHFDHYWSASSKRMDPPCESPKSNPRDRYSSHLMPCNITFHATSKEDKVGPMELSDACSADNRMTGSVAASTTLEDYLYNWPDACVGDFQRCYSIERDEEYFAKAFCENHWLIPNGTTHIAVDCTADKATKVEMIDEYNRHNNRNHNEISDDKNHTKTERMCVRRGYQLDQIYTTSFDRYWSTTSTEANQYRYNYDPTCENPKSNPRGQYISHLSPCNFTFHVVPEENHDSLGPMELPAVCSPENEHSGSSTTVLRDFVYKWPDECVGDFQRCYSVERNEAIFAEFFCHKHWNIPEEVTHIGVDCSEDKQNKLHRVHQKEEDQEKKEEEEEGLSGTQRMCSRLGFDLNKIYDDNYESRKWSPEDTNTDLRNNQPCTSRKSNARAKYTAHLSPCNFTFHKIPEGAQDTGPMELSDMCSSDNEFISSVSTTLQDYVQSWPDECVGDFQRCYHIEKHEKIFASIFCRKHWMIPEGATHVGVDCSMDKQLKLQQIKKTDEEWAKNGKKKPGFRNAEGRKEEGGDGGENFAYFEQELHGAVRAILTGIVFLSCLCFIGAFCSYNKIIKPFLASNHVRKNQLGYDEANSFEMNSFVINTSEHTAPLTPESPMRTTIKHAPFVPASRDLKNRLLEKA